MTPHSNPPKASFSQRQTWKHVARRIRVPMGFATAALYVFEVTQHPARRMTIVWSLALVVPGLALRAAAAGTVKKNRELTISGPYAYTRNPLYLGSALIAAGFALALQSWLLAVVLAGGFAVIYIPVIAGEEQFLRSTFSSFDDYCQKVPRFFPRLTPAKTESGDSAGGGTRSSFSFALYLKHREYNAALGAALLYLSLLYLQPLIEMLLSRIR